MKPSTPPQVPDDFQGSGGGAQGGAGQGGQGSNDPNKGAQQGIELVFLG